MRSVGLFQGDPVRITRRARDEIRRVEADRIERVCAALRAVPGLTDGAARMYARTILTPYSAGPPPAQCASESTPTKPKRFTLWRGKKSCPPNASLPRPN